MYRRVQMEKTIRLEDLTEDGKMLYYILILLKDLEVAEDRNDPKWTRKIKAMKEVLVTELFS